MDFRTCVSGGLRLAEQVVGDRQAEQLFVGLGSLPGRLAGRQLAEPIQPLSLELEKLAGVVFVDRLQGGTGSPGSAPLASTPQGHLDRRHGSGQKPLTST